MAEKLKFYCMKCKHAVSTANYKIVKKSGRKFAVGKDSCGTKIYRILGKA